MSVFKRATCGCVVLLLGQDPDDSDVYRTLLLWSCGPGESPFCFCPTVTEKAKLQNGRFLTGPEERRLLDQLQRRFAAGERMQDLWSALHSVESLNQGRTDASPCEG